MLTDGVPKARAYHTVSTGYAGLLASFAQVMHDVPMILTEHGIYTKERRIEIHAADWIPIGPAQTIPDKRPPYFQWFWNRHFGTMSKVCYERAQKIFTLYVGNRDEQVEDGADADKISIVPNGIDVGRFAPAAARHASRSPDEPFTVGFVGRVCPIKDVRTFIAAMRLVANQVPNLQAQIIGPAEECRERLHRGMGAPPRHVEFVQSFGPRAGIVLRLDGFGHPRESTDRAESLVGQPGRLLELPRVQVAHDARALGEPHSGRFRHALQPVRCDTESTGERLVSEQGSVQ